MSSITVDVTVNRDIDHVWRCWTDPQCITKWNQASADWHCPKAVNDLAVGGKFSATMAAKDGTASFDFEGIYTKVEKNGTIEYALGDERKVLVTFEKMSDTSTKITETFDAETENTVELQRSGWSAILQSFKSHCEGHR